MAPQSDDPFRARRRFSAWPGLRAMRLHTPVDIGAPRRSSLDGDDSIVFLVNNLGLIALSQGGNDASIGPGQALGVLHAEHSSLTTVQVDYIAFGIPRAALTPLVDDVEGAAMRLIPRDNAVLLLPPCDGVLRRGPLVDADPRFVFLPRHVRPLS